MHSSIYRWSAVSKWILITRDKNGLRALHTVKVHIVAIITFLQNVTGEGLVEDLSVEF